MSDQRENDRLYCWKRQSGCNDSVELLRPLLQLLQRELESYDAVAGGQDAVAGDVVAAVEAKRKVRVENVDGRRRAARVAVRAACLMSCRRACVIRSGCDKYTKFKRGKL